MEFTTEERFKKAKIKLQSKSPFFSYLSLFIQEQKAKKGELPDWAGMGVNAKGELFYSEDFVKKISDDELIGVLTHEILHLSLLHLLRLGTKNREGWNIATDLVINHILEQNSFTLPKDCIKSKYDYGSRYGNKKDNGYVFKIGKKIIVKNVEEKNAEEVYDKLPKEFKSPSNRGYYVVVDENGKEIKGFDEHILGEGLTKEQAEKLKDEWENRISEAYISAKQRGQLPNCMERLIGKLHKEKIDWRTTLRKFITNEIASDYSWLKPSKRSVACGYYLPDIVKEKVKIGIAIDTSGSIGKEELTEFLSEIVGMAKAYKDKIDMVLYSHDTTISEKYEVRNGDIPKIMKISLKGGGGTSHIETINEIDKQNRDLKAVVFFTDGYSDINQIDFNKFRFKSIFVINKNGSDNQLENKPVIKIKIE